jgi:hypothetical protein
VNTKLRLCKHPDEDLFEDYCFDRLAEQETAKFEEHLLMCQECQRTLANTEDYIGLMKGASLAYAASRKGSHCDSAALFKCGGHGNDSRSELKYRLTLTRPVTDAP